MHDETEVQAFTAATRDAATEAFHHAGWALCGGSDRGAPDQIGSSVLIEIDWQAGSG
jgi:hypothetical protein